tara:strand:+ start:938 stop:1555 length:618 start_codon:yes stop_codon:yes gene_type:complete
MFNKGAMFGLDARIALAIFGALSVISGAALYSAIQDAKATAILTEIQEVGKAWEQYLLDTGQDTPILSSHITGRARTITELIESGVSGWKGPYLSLSKAGNSLAASSGGDFGLFAVSNLDWGIDDPTNTNWSYTAVKCNDTTIPCHVGIYISYDKKADIESILPIIDQKVDGGDGSFKGKVRWAECCFGQGRALTFIYAPFKMPQ